MLCITAWEAIRSDVTTCRHALSLITAAIGILTPTMYVFWTHLVLHQIANRVEPLSSEALLLTNLYSWSVLIFGSELFLLNMVLGCGGLHAAFSRVGPLLYSAPVRLHCTTPLRRVILKVLRQDFSRLDRHASVVGNFTLTYGGLFPVTRETCLKYFCEICMTSLLFNTIYSL